MLWGLGYGCSGGRIRQSALQANWPMALLSLQQMKLQARLG